jgi:glycosyltransferase involved in cell wall biosynthesis
MQKVLILSYFFPPCNLTASQRVHSWARYLNKCGYYPIVVTRRWDYEIKVEEDQSKSTREKVMFEQHDGYEVHYLPYRGNLKDRIYARHGNSRYVLFRRTLSIIELLLQPYLNSVIPYRNLYNYSRKLLAEQKDVKKLIISGNPYVLFKFGYLLNKEFGIKWIADYRDAWTTSEIDLLGRPELFKIIYSLDRKFERKWVGSSSAVTSVSEPILEKISRLVGVNGKWISNGFEDGEFDNLRHLQKYNSFTISYIGTLYSGQQIEVFLEAFKMLVTKYKTDIRMLFPGLSFNKDQHERVANRLKGFEAYYECSPRSSKQNSLEVEVRSHILLYPAWKGFDGIIPSKIFEYNQSKTLVMITPTDHGEVEKIVMNSHSGICTNDVEDTFRELEKIYLRYKNGEEIKSDFDEKNSDFFSREHQAIRMGALLDTI